MYSTIKFITVSLLFTNFHQLRLLVHGKSSSSALMFNENMQRNRAFKCGAPQPRVVKWEKILDTSKEKLNECEVIYPHVAVLHKCDFEAGCCPAHQVCTVSTSEEVPVVFKVMRIKRFGYDCTQTSNESTRFIHATIINHTACACEDAQSYPK